MSWRTTSTVLFLRTLGRSLRLNRVLANLWGSARDEIGFRRALLEAVRPGDCVWDVGANVGCYTRRFSNLVGPKGKVVAFEPSQQNRVRLREAVQDLLNVSIFPVALGDRKAVVPFQQGADHQGATSRISLTAGSWVPREPGLRIQLERGDDLIQSGRVPSPHVVKIDTEGFELDVLHGLARTIAGRGLRAVGVEVHFGLSAERGLPQAPATIETLLTSAGYRCSWVDASHIVGLRTPQ